MPASPQSWSVGPDPAAAPLPRSTVSEWASAPVAEVAAACDYVPRVDFGVEYLHAPTLVDEAPNIGNRIEYRLTVAGEYELRGTGTARLDLCIVTRGERNLGRPSLRGADGRQMEVMSTPVCALLPEEFGAFGTTTTVTLDLDQLFDAIGKGLRLTLVATDIEHEVFIPHSVLSGISHAWESRDVPDGVLRAKERGLIRDAVRGR